MFHQILSFLKPEKMPEFCTVIVWKPIEQKKPEWKMVSSIHHSEQFGECAMFKFNIPATLHDYQNACKMSAEIEKSLKE